MYSIEYLLDFKKGIASSMPAKAADVFGFFAKNQFSLKTLKGNLKWHSQPMQTKC